MALSSSEARAQAPQAFSGDAKRVASRLRRALKKGGSAERAAGIQWFFKEVIKSHGWRTAALRRAVRECRKEIQREHDFSFLVQVADEMFSGSVLEEKIAAVLLLE